MTIFILVKGSEFTSNEKFKCYEKNLVIKQLKNYDN